MSPGARDLGPEEVPGWTVGCLPLRTGVEFGFTWTVWDLTRGEKHVFWAARGGWLERPQLFSILSGCSCLSLQWK